MKNMKKNKKNGFTIAEILVALAIIGILTMLALQTTTPANKSAAKYLYMNAYQALTKAYYNAVMSGYDPFSTVSDDEGNVPVFTNSKDTGAETLCKGLTTYINTTTNEKKSDKDYSTSCSDTKLTSELADTFDEDNIQFTATNGMDFYISKKLSVDDTFEFYLVFVDTNGYNKGPNAVEYTYAGKTQNEKNKILPDIFAFALIDTGRVCPIGIPEYDNNILTARFAYFDTSGDTYYSLDSMSYYQAKGAAWGFYNTDGPDGLTDYNLDEPFSLNDVIRDAINSNSKIVEDFPDIKTELEPVTVASESPYSCTSGTYEDCYIFLDNYRQY